MGACLVDPVFGKGDVLELGAGTGNGTRHVLRRFSDKQSLPSKIRGEQLT